MQENNFSFIWEKMLVDNMNKYNENNDVGPMKEAEKLIFKGYPINLNNFTNYILYNNKNRKQIKLEIMKINKDSQIYYLNK